MKPYNTQILFPCILLRLGKSSGSKLKSIYLYKHTNKHPVTLGSKVPEWPVFSTSKIFFTHDTTSWELGFEGLSKLIIPYFRYSLSGLFKGVEPAGMGV